MVKLRPSRQGRERSSANWSLTAADRSLPDLSKFSAVLGERFRGDGDSGLHRLAGISSVRLEGATVRPPRVDGVRSGSGDCVVGPHIGGTDRSSRGWHHRKDSTIMEWTWIRQQMARRGCESFLPLEGIREKRG